MTYVVANIHGEYQKFQDLLSTIRFRESDEMYLLGDIVDYGEGSMELIADLSVRVNVYPIVGEHDFQAMMVLSEVDKMLKGGYQPEPATLGKMAAWMQDGGEPTLRAFRALDEEQREGVLEYLEDMLSFEELTVKGHRYLLAHAGIDNFEDGKALDDYSEEDFVFAKTDYSKVYFKNKYLITGHTPTVAINQKFMGKVYSKNGHIALDCGAAYGGKLAAICLDALKLTYC